MINCQRRTQAPKLQTNEKHKRGTSIHNGFALSFDLWTEMNGARYAPSDNLKARSCYLVMHAIQYTYIISWHDQSKPSYLVLRSNLPTA